eukprot:750862-Hanusia_phi.AAC.1
MVNLDNPTNPIEIEERPAMGTDVTRKGAMEESPSAHFSSRSLEFLLYPFLSLLFSSLLLFSLSCPPCLLLRSLSHHLEGLEGSPHPRS